MKRLYFVNGLHNVLFFGACVGLLFATTLTLEAFIDVADFKVINVELVCQQPLNNRCAYNYTLRQSNGLLIGGKQFSAYLYRDNELRPGNQILKRRFSFAYLVNGQEKQWDYAGQMLTVMLLSGIVLTVWYRWTKSLN